MAQEMSIKRVLLSDVAKLAGLSKATLSRYMNNSIVLPQDTIDRIETAIRELDYRGNSLARRLSKGGSETLGLVLPDITNPFFAELADAAEEAASASGYSLVLCITRNNPEKECQFIRWLDTCQVDGLLFTTNRPDNGQLREQLKGQRHVVLLDEDVPGSTVPKVFSDNVHGGELAAIKDTLDQLEPVAQQPTQARPAQALYSWPLAAALLLSMLLVIRELWPNNPVQRWLSKEHFLQQHPDWRARLTRLRLRRRR